MNGWIFLRFSDECMLDKAEDIHDFKFIIVKLLGHDLIFQISKQGYIFDLR